MDKAERNRVTVLLAVLVALLLVWVALRHRSGAQAGGASGAAEVSYTARTVPVLDLAALTPLPKTSSRFERNPFTFGRPPTPTPNLTPRPTLPPRPTRTPRPTPTPYRIHTSDGRTLGPPPSFTAVYIGYFGPSELPVAVFRKGKRVEVAPKGGILDDVFIIRKVGYDSVEIGYVGYPEEVTKRVPLETKK